MEQNDLEQSDYVTRWLDTVVNCGLLQSGLKINFFVQEPAGNQQKKFVRQCVNFGRQPILYITLVCMKEKSQLKSENNYKQHE